MDNTTINRAYEIICDRPGITRGELAEAMRISDRSAGQCISDLHHIQHRVEKAGYRNYPSSQVGQVGKHLDPKDLTIRSSRQTPGPKGLSSKSAKSAKSASTYTEALNHKEE